MAPLKVLITGAGIGGSALAFWLAKLKHDVTVIERHHCLRVNGLQLDLRGYGIEVMRRMGLEKVIRSKLVPEEGIALVDSTGRRRAFVAANKTGKGAQSVTSEFEIMRRDICQILHDAAVEQGAKYIFDAYLDGFDEQDGVVNVTFADGKTDSFDMVVGADGLSSRLRRLMLAKSPSDEKDTLVELNERMAFFTIPKPIEPNEEYIGTAYLMPGKRFVLTRRHSPKEIQVYLKCETDFGPTDLVGKMQKGDVKSEKAAFAEMFRESGWETDKLVQAMQDGADDFYCQYSGFVKMDRWSRGRVTLVGDAAHGAPADGQGTSAALIGAYILAGEIERHCSADTIHSTDTSTDKHAGEAEQDHDSDPVLAALDAYEHKLHPYIKHIHQGLSAEPNFFDKIPWTPFTVNLMLYLAWFITYFGIDKVLAQMFPSEGIKGWDLPEYPMVKS